MAGHRFQALDSCRGLCAVAVMIFHLDADTHFRTWSVVRNSWVAVDFFFVLSGFVIASAYGGRLRTANDVCRFAIRRIGRLYPLHIVVLATFLGLELVRLFLLRAPDAFADNTTVSALFADIFLVQGFTPDQESWNYPAWSISVELWVNLAFALAAVLLRGGFLSCVLLGIAIAGAYTSLSDRLPLTVSPAELPVLLDLARSIFGFLLGMITFALFDAARRYGWRLPRPAELVVVPLVACAFGFTDDLPRLGPPLLFSAVVFLLAFEAGPLSRLLKRPAFLSLGIRSYSIYLTHSLYLVALGAIAYAVGNCLGLQSAVFVDGDDRLVLGGRWAMDGVAFLCVTATIIGSGLTYRYIEEPSRVHFNRLSNRFLSDADASNDVVAAQPL